MKFLRSVSNDSDIVQKEWLVVYSSAETEVVTIKKPLGRIVVRLSAVSGGTITLNEGMSAGGSMAVDMGGYSLTALRKEDMDMTIGGVKYYCYDYMGAIQLYTVRNVSGSYSSEPYYVYDGSGMVEAARYDIVLVVSEAGGPVQKVINYTAGDNQEFEIDTPVVTFKNVGAGLKYIEIPEGTKEIVSNSFSSSEKLTGVTVYDGLETIEHDAFYACTGLTNIDIPDSVIEIGDRAFAVCYSLTEMKLPKNLLTIGEGAFYASRLRSIVVPNKVTTIGESAFAQCVSLKTVTLPSSLTSLSNGLFNLCNGLEKIIYKGTKAQWNALPKGQVWLSGLAYATVTVQCTDGNIVYTLQSNGAV